jgi:hypothetical protein
MRNVFRTLSLLVIWLACLISLGCPFDKSVTETRPIGPDLTADLLIYFNINSSQEQINAFQKAVLSRPHPEGRGEYLPPGVRTLLAIGPVEGHEGFAITFFRDATSEQRQELLRAIKSSSLVYKVLENRAPDSVKTLN